MKIVSGSKLFLEWLEKRIYTNFRVTGGLYKNNSGKFEWYFLKYGKLAAAEILRSCYIPSSLHLHRKYELAKKCVNAKRRWRQSKTTSIARVAELVDARDSKNKGPLRGNMEVGTG